MTEEDIKYMVDRFLAWTVPADFAPDGGISFTPPQPPHWPTGTNLLTATRANMMVRYMIEGLCEQDLPSKRPAVATLGVRERLASVVEYLRDGRKPTPHDLYRAVKNVGSGWRYEPLGLGVGDLEAILALTETKQPVIDTKPDDLAHGPEVPHHRFSTFHTAGDYAYARGLEINPQHLPVALDAMQKSGWALLAIFGQTDSKHVGFIFERCIHEIKLPTVEQNPEFAEAIQLYLDGKPLADMMVCGADGRGRGLEP